MNRRSFGCVRFPRRRTKSPDRGRYHHMTHQGFPKAKHPTARRYVAGLSRSPPGASGPCSTSRGRGTRARGPRWLALRGTLRAARNSRACARGPAWRGCFSSSMCRPIAPSRSTAWPSRSTPHSSASASHSGSTRRSIEIARQRRAEPRGRAAPSCEDVYTMLRNTAFSEHRRRTRACNERLFHGTGHATPSTA